MEELNLLQSELKLMLDNIERVKKYIKDPENSKHYSPTNCLVVGELKHRSVALKNRLVIINKITTQYLFNS